MDFHEQLEPLRLQVKRTLDAGEFTQGELARRAGLAQSTISNFVRKFRGLSRDSETALMRALHLTPHLLFAAPPQIEPLPDDPVPIVKAIYAITASKILRNLVTANSNYLISQFRHLPDRAGASRRGWTRFVAINVTEAQAKFLPPLIHAGATVIIDRHNQQLARSSQSTLLDPPLYAVADDNFLCLGHLLVSTKEIILKSPRQSLADLRIPLGTRTPSQLIVGRICAVSTLPR